jgi:hypothetical protein
MKEENNTKQYIYGYNDNTFKPNAFITRAQMAAMLARSIDVDDLNSFKGYKYIKESFWAFREIGIVITKGLC